MLLELLLVAQLATPMPGIPYDRGTWPHWSDADGDCRNTRHEVLTQESLVPVEYDDARECKVARGLWVCPYTGEVFTNPSDLDVDHTIALKEAHLMGGDRWSRKKKRAYANYMNRTTHLMATKAGANRSKSYYSESRWMPRWSAAHCWYADTRLKIRTRWFGLDDLSLDDAKALLTALATCPDEPVPGR